MHAVGQNHSTVNWPADMYSLFWKSLTDWDADQRHQNYKRILVLCLSVSIFFLFLWLRHPCCIMRQRRFLRTVLFAVGAHCSSAPLYCTSKAVQESQQRYMAVDYTKYCLWIGADSHTQEQMHARVQTPEHSHITASAWTQVKLCQLLDNILNLNISQQVAYPIYLEYSTSTQQYRVDKCYATCAVACFNSDLSVLLGRQHLIHRKRHWSDTCQMQSLHVGPFLGDMLHCTFQDS